MTAKTILYISNQAAGSKSVSAALAAAGFNVVNTNRSKQGPALLFVMHCVAGVVLDDSLREQTAFDEARSLKAICPNTPIVLLRHDSGIPVPSFVDALVNTEQPRQKVISAVRRFLKVKPFPGVPPAVLA